MVPICAKFQRKDSSPLKICPGDSITWRFKRNNFILYKIHSPINHELAKCFHTSKYCKKRTTKLEYRCLVFVFRSMHYSYPRTVEHSSRFGLLFSRISIARLITTARRSIKCWPERLNCPIISTPNAS